MRLKVAIFFVVVWILLPAPGCKKPATLSRGNDNVSLPAEIAGTWKAYNSPWKVVLSPDGRVVSAIIPLGEVEVMPNQTTRVKGWGGEPGIFEAGDFDVYYEPEYRELSVTIEIKRLYLEMGSILDGSCEYFIIGNFSEDGEFWNADVFSLLDVAVLSPDPNSAEGKPVFKQIDVLHADPNDASERLVFTKVENNGSKK